MRVLGYNSHLFFNTIVGMDGGSVFEDATRLDLIAEAVLAGSYDLVGFSEVWANKSKSRLRTLLKNPFAHSAWDENDNLFEIGSGLLLLSRYPITASEFTRYDDLVGADAFSQKGFVLARIDTGAETVAVVLTHTQAGNGTAEVNARTSNIEQLAKGISVWAGVSTPAILAGDLNVIGEDTLGQPTAEYEFLLKTLGALGMTDAYRVVHPDAEVDHGYTYDGVTNTLVPYFALADAENKVVQRLDYVFSGGFNPTSANVLRSFLYQSGKGEMDLSDHYPLDVEA